MRIFVTLGGSTSFSVNISAHALTHDLKRLISEEFRIPTVEQYLVYRGQLLIEEKPINEYGIRPGSTVFLYRHCTIEELRSEELKDKIDVLITAAPHLFNDHQTEDFLEANVMALENPKLISEMSRLTDLAMNVWESSVGGFSDLVRDYFEIEEADFLVQMMSIDTRFPTVFPGPLEAPATEPLPCLLFEDELPVNEPNSSDFGEGDEDLDPIPVRANSDSEECRRVSRCRDPC
jgi:hypothetical protein